MPDTLGKILINETLPVEYQVHGAVGKKELKKSMGELARKDPETYVKAITALKRVGDELATTEGLSIGLEDITPEYKKRDNTLAPYIRKFNKATTSEQRTKILNEAQGALTDIVDTHPGSLTLQVQSGARGNKVQYANMVSAVGAARDPKGGLVPWLIGRSYAEGLKPSDYYAATNQSMMDTIKTQTAVSEPGELAKKLISVMSDNIITEDDCGTDNGVTLDPKSPDAIDRYLAKDTGQFKRNTLVTTVNQSALAKYNTQILVRSPMTCESSDGVCKYCQGLDEKGHLHVAGINVGIRAAQAMAEPLTQFALNAKHGGRTLASDKKQLTGILGFRQIIETPKQFMHQAILARVDGKVTKIEEAPQGGYFVAVGSESHYVPPGFKVLVKLGTTVYQGDRLSDGIPKPDEVVRYKGLGPGRVYMVDTLKQLYETQGKSLDSRHFELLAKSNMNHVRILEDPSHTFIKGDIVNFNNLKASLAQNTKLIPLKAALGETLGKGLFMYTAGTRITKEVFEELKKKGVKDVIIAPRAPKVEFVMKSATSVPKMHSDWIGRLAHQGLKDSILQAAHTGEVSDLQGTHHIPAYIHGATFGSGPDGRY
jgi:DNA-directed RNA polymerase subunit beta'